MVINNTMLRNFPVWIFFLLLTSLLHATSYEWTDEKGGKHFVNAIENVPSQYRNKVQCHREKYDGLSPEQKAKMIEEENRKTAAREDEGHLKDLLKPNPVFREALPEAQQKETAPVSGELWVQRVDIKHNAVYIPVILGYRGREIQVPFLLDTGCTSILLHRETAEQLNLDFSRLLCSQGRVADGRLVQAYQERLDYIRVGPFIKKDVIVDITENAVNDSSYHGLLGMAFLKDHPYNIDFEHKLIQWKNG
jgi:hypothetical protein